jgi:hypothetical protein
MLIFTAIRVAFMKMLASLFLLRANYRYDKEWDTVLTSVLDDPELEIVDINLDSELISLRSNGMDFIIGLTIGHDLGNLRVFNGGGIDIFDRRVPKFKTSMRLLRLVESNPPTSNSIYHDMIKQIPPTEL